MQTAPFLWSCLSHHPSHSHSHSSWAYRAWPRPGQAALMEGEQFPRTLSEVPMDLSDSMESCRAQDVARAHAFPPPSPTPHHKTHSWATSRLLEWLNQKYSPHQDWQRCGTMERSWIAGGGAKWWSLSGSLTAFHKVFTIRPSNLTLLCIYPKKWKFMFTHTPKITHECL